MDRNRSVWERIGKHDPYFGVVSHPQNRGVLQGAAKVEFFKGGREHVDMLWEDILSFRNEFNPRNALDFGCGVGRLLIPLAQRCQKVTGVDISGTMLAEAKRNCAEASLKNVELAHDWTGEFDFLHSYIVFQHIPQRRGLELIRQLVCSLSRGGVGALHVLHTAPTQKRIANLIRQFVPLAHVAANLVTGSRGPLMQMNPYSINQLLSILQGSNCQVRRVRFTDHSGWLGAMLYFERNGGS